MKHHTPVEGWADEESALVGSLRAQIETLRTALTEIAELYSGGYGYRATEIAKTALNDQPGYTQYTSYRP